MLRVASDCSGVGTYNFALNALKITYQNVFACEIEEKARRTYIANHGEPNTFYRDLTTRDNSNAPESDVYIGSFPCQTFSAAGKGAGENDPRGLLFYHGHDYIIQKKPRFFVLENVMGLLYKDRLKGSKSKYGPIFVSWVEKLGKEINGIPVGAWAQTIDWKAKEFGLFNQWQPNPKCCNYHLRLVVMNAKDFGVPQNRERIFLCGFRDKADYLDFEIPKPFLLEKCLQDILEKDVSEAYNLSLKAVKSIVLKMGNMQKASINPEIAACLQSPGNACGIYKGCNLVMEEADGIIINEKEKVNKIQMFTPKNTAQDQRIHYTNGISQCMPASDSNVPKILEKIVQLNPSKESNDAQPYMQNRVYDTKGIFPALTEFASRLNIFEEVDQAIFQRPHGFNKDGFKNLCPTITSSAFQDNNLVVENVMLRRERTEEAKAIRRENQKNGIDSTPFQMKHFVPRTDGIAPCQMVSDMKSQYVFELKYYVDKDGHVLKIAIHGEGGEKMIVPLAKYRIRRLTEKECQRLMDWPENFVQPNNKTAAYKQCGNGIVTACLRELFIGI